MFGFWKFGFRTFTVVWISDIYSDRNTELWFTYLRQRLKNIPRRFCSTWSSARAQSRNSAWIPHPDFLTWSGQIWHARMVLEDTSDPWSLSVRFRMDPCRTFDGCFWFCGVGFPWQPWAVWQASRCWRSFLCKDAPLVDEDSIQGNTWKRNKILSREKN